MNALVTGSTKGIGLAIAKAFMQKGYHVYINYAHDDKGVKNLADYDKYTVIKADLSLRSGAEELVKAIGGTKLDCIVLNAGATCYQSFEEMPHDEWYRVMDTNVNVPFFLLQGLNGNLNDNASVIFIASAMGIYPHAVSIPYSVSKAAAIMLAKSLVKVFAPRGIRVNAICPGFIDTQWQKEKAPDHRKRIEDKISLGYFGSPGDIGKACADLLDNPYITGAVIEIDGGYCMR